MLPNGGTAELSYVFGYKSKSLIQVGAVWSKGTDAAMTPEKLFSNANILRAHFLSEGFKPDSIAVNMPVNGGIVMFRGSDAKDRSVILLLQGTFENKENNQRVLTPDQPAAVLRRRRQEPRHLQAAARPVLMPDDLTTFSHPVVDRRQCR